MDSQAESVGLEDRLRGLILSSSESSTTATISHEAQSRATGGEGLDQAARSSQKPVRKRLNQAQRREMSAQLTIPVDTRPEPVAPVRSHPGPPGFTGQRHQQASRGGHQHASRGLMDTFMGSQQGMPPNPTVPGANTFRGGHSHRGRPQGQRGDANVGHMQPQHRRLYNPDQPQQYNHQQHRADQNMEAQIEMLDKLCIMIRTDAEIDNSILMEKEMFRMRLEGLCREVVFRYEYEQHGLGDFPAHTVELKCFGSLASGFATKASDMDLALISPFSPLQPDAPGSPIPRLMEGAILQVGLGARLLTRTRVPIIKVCQNPPEKLRADLITERMKWEQGLVEKVEDRDEEDHHDDNPKSAHQRSPGETPAHILPHDHNEEDNDVTPDSTSYADMLASHKQGGKNLQGYIGMTYKLLRKLGGRDMTALNHRTFSLQDYAILKDVIRAFIGGLSDEELKMRLEGKRSLAELQEPDSFKHRTLASVFTQVEGEIMAMSWSPQLYTGRAQALRRAAEEAYFGWMEVQDKPTFGDDPLFYAKELQGRFQRLQTIPSLQLRVLQQSQFESASDYHARVLQILTELGGRDEPGPATEILSTVVRQYVAGIRNNDIREAVQELSESLGVTSLRGVARMHKSLQLASELEKALAKGAFDGPDEEPIKYYVDWLRRMPMAINSQSPNEWFDYVVPADEYLTQVVIPTLLRLQDPAELAQNKPRDPYHDKLEFPKDGVGAQCDINFSAHLALHNTALLRCYSLTDPRVRPLVLFVKHWAKVRGINNPYRGSLNSYGYVLMVLHYLVNVVQPFVCPNLQQLAPPADPRFVDENGVNTQAFCKGFNIEFWRDEQEIARLAAQKGLNQNEDSLGKLLRGFFEYYAQGGYMSTTKGRGFHYGRDVISLRTLGGIVTKEEKGWTNAKTTVEVKTIAAPPGIAPSPLAPNAAIPADAGASADAATTSEVKEVRHRYLLAIEDPFELNHNVARTVTHNGIVAIRDEFRRAWRIIQNVGKSGPQEDLLLDAAAAEERSAHQKFATLLDEIHGWNQGHRPQRTNVEA